jgi:hypothetical protein
MQKTVQYRSQSSKALVAPKPVNLVWCVPEFTSARINGINSEIMAVNRGDMESGTAGSYRGYLITDTDGECCMLVHPLGSDALMFMQESERTV